MSTELEQLDPAAALDAEDLPGGAREVVFVGGTGRSGTHVLGALLGHHSRFRNIPIESRFHCNRKGFPDLLEGRVTLEVFLDKLQHFWWHRVRVDGQPRGLYNVVRRRAFEAAVEEFEPAYARDPVSACRALFIDLLWPMAEADGKPGLVEMSSHNIRQAATLRRLFPEARFVHTVRDGRDAASSVSTMTWGPDNVIDGIDWWADRLRRIDVGVHGEEDGADYSLPADRLHVVVLDDLVHGDREPTYTALLGFLGLEDEQPIREFFDGRMSPSTAHKGRWAEGMGRLQRRRVLRKYVRTLEGLREEGNHCAPDLIASYERGKRS
jgi:hypothetical protein